MNDLIPTITVHNIYFILLVIFIPFYNIHIVVNNCLIQCKLNQIKLYMHLNKIHILISNNSNQESLLNRFKIKYDYRCDMDKVYIHNHIYQSFFYNIIAEYLSENEYVQLFLHVLIYDMLPVRFSFSLTYIHDSANA